MGAGFLSTPLAHFVKAAPGLMPLSEQCSLMAAQNRCESLTGSEHICHWNTCKVAQDVSTPLCLSRCAH